MVRFHTVTESNLPDLSKFSAIGAPMMPMPTTPTFILVALSKDVATATFLPRCWTLIGGCARLTLHSGTLLPGSTNIATQILHVISKAEEPTHPQTVLVPNCLYPCAAKQLQSVVTDDAVAQHLESIRLIWKFGRPQDFTGPDAFVAAHRVEKSKARALLPPRVGCSTFSYTKDEHMVQQVKAVSNQVLFVSARVTERYT
jgi:hypothetical protein